MKNIFFKGKNVNGEKMTEIEEIKIPEPQINELEPEQIEEVIFFIALF